MAAWEEVVKSGASSDRMEYVVVSSSAVSVSVDDDIPREKVALAEGKEAEGEKAHTAPTAVERMTSFILLRISFERLVVEEKEGKWEQLAWMVRWMNRIESFEDIGRSDMIRYMYERLVMCLGKKAYET